MPLDTQLVSGKAGTPRAHADPNMQVVTTLITHEESHQWDWDFGLFQFRRLFSGVKNISLSSSLTARKQKDPQWFSGRTSQVKL